LNKAPCKAWDVDASESLPRVVANIRDLWPEIEAAALSRPRPALTLALEWHRRIYAGVAVPEPDYIGHVRDSDPQHPCLIDYEVLVGGQPGIPARDVPAALDDFLHATSTITDALDAAVDPRTIPVRHREVMAIVRLCAYTHGEWVRIHPFANGNGRTARVWANWLAVRYGLPPFVRIKPKPDDLVFAGAAALSMRGDHHATEALFTSLLRQALAESLPATE